MSRSEGKYCMIYADNGHISIINFARDSVEEDGSVTTGQIIISSKNGNTYATNDYNELVNFIFDNNLYKSDESQFEIGELKSVEESVETTLFKYDD